MRRHIGFGYGQLRAQGLWLAVKAIVVLALLANCAGLFRPSLTKKDCDKESYRDLRLAWSMRDSTPNGRHVFRDMVDRAEKAASPKLLAVAKSAYESSSSPQENFDAMQRACYEAVAGGK